MAFQEGTFPLLSAKDLVQELPLIFPDLRFTSVDLRSPTTERVHVIYKAILREIGIDVENINLPCYSVYETTDHEYLLEETFPLIHFMCIMNKTLQIIGANDFCIEDLVRPKPKRTRRFLSCFCNFLKFISSRSEFYTSRVNKAKDLRIKCDEKKKIIYELEEQLKTLRNKQEHDDQQRAILTSAFESKKEQLQQMKLLKVEKQKESAIKKAKNAELSSQSENNVQRIQALKEVKEEHSRLIIKSPEKAFKKIDELKQEVEKLKRERKMNHNRLFEMQQYSEKSKVWAVDLEHILVLLDRECEANKIHMELKTKAQIALNKKELLKTQLQDIRVETEEGQRKMKIQEEGKSQTIVQCKAKLMSLQESLEQIKNELHRLEQRKKDNGAEFEKLNCDVKNSVVQKETILADKTARSKCMHENMHKINDMVKIYGQRLVHKLDENQKLYEELFAKYEKL